MAKDIPTILKGLVRPAWSGYQDVVDIALEEPARIGELVRAAITGLAKSAPVIDALLGLVPDPEIQDIADACVGALRQGADPNDSQAASLVPHLSMQAPQSFHRHLGALWELRPNERSYYAEWPWRAASMEDDTRWLLRRFSDEPANRERAFRCLLESRTDLARAAAIGCVGNGIIDDARAAAFFLGVGFERQGSTATRLFHEVPHHVAFPDGFLRLPRWVKVNGTFVDPTWQFREPIAGQGYFGGTVDAACRICDGLLHRLLRFDSPELARSLFGTDQVELVTCLSCLGWSKEVMFFDHRAGVRPFEPDVEKRPPEFPARAFPEAPVSLVTTPPRWRLQDWACSNSRESLHRVGGEPTWIQDAEFPQCARCQKTMMFVAQLDSLDFGDTREWLWGSGGIVYVFWCARCLTSATRWQCT